MLLHFCPCMRTHIRIEHVQIPLRRVPVNLTLSVSYVRAPRFPTLPPDARSYIIEQVRAYGSPQRKYVRTYALHISCVRIRVMQISCSMRLISPEIIKRASDSTACWLTACDTSQRRRRRRASRLSVDWLRYIVRRLLSVQSAEPSRATAVAVLLCVYDRH